MPLGAPRPLLVPSKRKHRPRLHNTMSVDVMIRAGQKLLEVLTNTVSLLLFATIAPPRYPHPSFSVPSFSCKHLYNFFFSFRGGGAGEKFVGNPQTDGDP